MGELDDLIGTVEVELRQELDVDAWLRPLRDEVRHMRQPGATLDRSSKTWRPSHRALESASERLTRLETLVRHLSDLLPVLPGEWSERESQLTAALDSDLRAGVVLWLRDWWIAVGLGRLDAMDRLIGLLSQAPAARMLAERCEIIPSGLRSKSWGVVARALEPFVVVDGEWIPDQRSRARLAALSARMWLLHIEANSVDAEGDPDVASIDLAPHLRRVTELEKAAALGRCATADALGARWQRLRGDSETSEKFLARARKADPVDLDVASERIVEERGQGDYEAAAGAAAGAIAAIPLVIELEPRIDALFYPAPVELWIAASQRALDERDFAVFDRTIARSRETADWQDNLSRARIAELAVTAIDVADAASGDAPAEDRVRALIEAGSNRLWSGAPERAIPHLRRAFKLAPDSAAGLFLASSLVASSESLPLSAARGRLHEALDVLSEVRQRRGLLDDDSWNFVTEAYARQPLLNGLEAEAENQAWPALLAACRAVAYDFADPTRWRALAETLSSMRADDLALDVARYIDSKFDPDPEWRLLLGTRLTLAGRPDEALQTIESLEEFGSTDFTEFTQAWRAVCSLRVGNAVEAVRLLRTVNLNPDWNWAAETLVSSLILTGRMSEALDELPSIERYSAERMDQRSTLVSRGWLQLMKGRFREAEELCAKLPDRSDESGLVAGAAAVLQGRQEEGCARLKTWIEESAGRIELFDFPVVSAPELRVLAIKHESPFPALDELSELAIERIGALSEPTYPQQTRTVGDFIAHDGDPVAESALGMCDALLHVARGVASQGKGSISALGEDEVVAVLRRSLDDVVARAVDSGDDLPVPDQLVIGDSEAEWSQLASELIVLIGEDRTDEARERLKEFLVRDPNSVAFDLATAAGSNYEVYTAITDLVFDIATESGQSVAREVGGWLRRRTVLRLFLPPSWFAGQDDPVSMHVLFTRYIPEARVRTPILPTIDVAVDADLEPAAYGVALGMDLLEHEQLLPARRFAPQAARPLFEADSDQPWDEVLPGIVAVPDSQMNALGELVSMSAEEIIMSRAEALYRSWWESLEAAEESAKA